MIKNLEVKNFYRDPGSGGISFARWLQNYIRQVTTVNSNVTKIKIKKSSCFIKNYFISSYR